MNSKCRTIFGLIMLIAIMAVAAYYIGSALYEADCVDHLEYHITYDTSKNYLSPISVSSFPIDKTGTLTDSVVLVQKRMNAAPSSINTSLIQRAIAGAADLYTGVAAYIRDVNTALNIAAKKQLAEQKKQDGQESYLLTLDNQESYLQNKNQQELDNTTQQLFDHLFVTDDSKIEQYLNVREAPNGDVIGRLQPATGGTLLDMQNGWAEISSGSVTGWVDASYILTGTAVIASGAQLTVVVDQETLVFRREANTASEAMDILTKGTTADYSSYVAGWVCVSYNGVKGYLKAEYVHLEVGSNEAVPMTEALWNETLKEAGLVQEAETAETQEVVTEAVVEETAAVVEEPVAVTPSADDLARQRIDAIYAEGRSSMSPIYLNADEIYLLSCVIMMEAGGEAYEGKLAVAGVVMNRLRSGMWGSTLNEVIYYPKQFTGAGTGLLANILASGPNDECVRAAYEAAAGVHNIGGYMFFCSAGTANYGAYSSYLVIDKQCFYAK